MDKKNITALGMGIVIGALGYAVISSTPHMAGHDMHSHTMLMVDPKLPVPSLTIEVAKDAKDGFNLHVTTKHFTFTPEKANQPPVPNEGHAHVLVNGTKVMRLYGPWVHLPSSLFAHGKNVVTVTLNANDHSEWMSGDDHIEAEQTIENE
jgi:hypothetical protein